MFSIPFLLFFHTHTHTDASAVKLTNMNGKIRHAKHVATKEKKPGEKIRTRAPAERLGSDQGKW